MWNHRTEKFILDLDREVYVRVLKTIHLLIEQGNKITMPDSKSLGKGLFELRIVGKSHVRLLYFFHKNKSYIIHGFIKKTWKINARDIDYARKIQKEVMELA